MPKHEDLKAARIIAGLNQTQAAKLMGVHRGTFNGWERGWRPLPETKFYKFLKAVEVTPAALNEYWSSQPVGLVYDKDGYPAPFNRKDEDEALNTEDDGTAYTMFMDALEALEGDQHIQRARVRHEKRTRDNLKGMAPDKLEEMVQIDLASWDQEHLA